MKCTWLNRSAWLLPVLCAAASASGATPTPAQLLAVRPAQADVSIDTPDAASYRELKVSPFRSGRMSGWLLRDAQGNLLRFFLDTNGDAVIDQWRFYRGGREVYRDIDTNRNGRPDQHRWLNEGGTRWAVDVNEDGVVDGYKVMSLEELLVQLTRSLNRRDYALLKPLVATGADLAGRAAPQQLTESLRAITPTAFTELTRRLQKLGGKLTVERLDLAHPLTLPGAAVDGSMDLVAYRDLMVVFRGSGDKMEVMRLPWVVRIGAAWKLAGLPAPADQAAAVAASPQPQHDGASDQLHELIEQLQQLDQQLAAASTSARQGPLHLQRARLLRQIAQQSEPEQAELWWRQAVDSTLIAVEGRAAGADVFLRQLEQDLRSATNNKELISYLRYHRLASEYARRFQQPNVDFMEVQKQYLRDLEEFVKAASGTTVAAEALLQLGIGYELIGDAEKANAAYDQIRISYGRSEYAGKAEGALRRLSLDGKPFDWQWIGLSRTQTYRLRGKHVLVYFWAPWCEPCKEELKEIAQLQRRFGTTRLAVVTVVLDRDIATARAFLRSIGGTGWTVVEGKEGMDSEPAIKLGVFSLPTAFLIGPDGKVLHRNAHAEEVRTALERVAARR